MSDLPRLLLCSFDVIPGPSGSSRRMTEYLKALPERFSVVVLSVKTPDHSHIEKYQGARLLRVPVGSGDIASRAQFFERAVRRQLESEEYALVHFTDPFGGYALCELKRNYGYRLVYEAQDFPSQELPHTHPQLAEDTTFLSLVRRQELFCLMNADLVLTGSSTTRAFIHSLGVSQESVRVVRAPVDLRPYAPEALETPDELLDIYDGLLGKRAPLAEAPPVVRGRPQHEPPATPPALPPRPSLNTRPVPPALPPLPPRREERPAARASGEHPMPQPLEVPPRLRAAGPPSLPEKARPANGARPLPPPLFPPAAPPPLARAPATAEEPEEISEAEAEEIQEAEAAQPPSHAQPLEEPEEISSEDIQEAESDAPPKEPPESRLNPWFAQLAHGYCPPEGTHFARHTPPTTFPGRDEGPASSPAPRAQSGVWSKPS